MNQPAMPVLNDDEMMAAVTQLEQYAQRRIANIHEVTRELSAARDVRRKIQRIVTDLRREIDQCESEIERYKTEITKIGDYSKRAVANISKVRDLSALVPPPTVDISTLRRKKLIEDSVNLAAAAVRTVNDPCGVYFLLQSQEVVYVGQSVNVPARIAQHLQDNTKDFNRACYFPVSKGELNGVEAALISLLKPKFNRKGHAGGFYKTLPLVINTMGEHYDTE